MRVAYVSHYDARDVRHWSGTGHYIAQSLEHQGAQLDYVGPLSHQRSVVNAGRYVLNRYVRGQNDHPQRDPGFLRHYASQVARHVATHKPDVIVAPGSLPIAYLAADAPIVLWTDCTFANLLDFYPKFSNLSARTIRDGHEAERQAIARCALLIFSSDWAADSAIRDYGADPCRVRVVPFGANLSDPAGSAEVEALIQARADALSQGKLRLLCIGVDWKRKGMDFAVRVVQGLGALGIEAELVVAGCTPESGTILPEQVKLLGFLSKNSPDQARQLSAEFRKAHLFILPTRADCTPVVISEAAALGLPSVVTKTGGIGSIVRDGVNGRVFDLEAPAGDWAAYLAKLVRDRDSYLALGRSTYGAYLDYLNWEVAGRDVMTMIRQLVPRSGEQRELTADSVREHASA